MRDEQHLQRANMEDQQSIRGLLHLSLKNIPAMILHLRGSMSVWHDAMVSLITIEVMFLSVSVCLIVCLLAHRGNLLDVGAHPDSNDFLTF